MSNFFHKRRLSFGYAFSGIRYVLKSQPNTWIHLLITALVLGVGLVTRIDLVQWAILMLCFGMVWCAEIFNTAIEALVDLSSPDYHPLAKRCKDIAAGAVLVAAIFAVIIGVLILGPALYRFLAAN